jgi:hypothetical protein
VAQVPLPEYDDMIKTFPPDRANQPFRMAILPWRLWRGWPVANAHGTKPPVKISPQTESRSRTMYVGVHSQPQASVSWRHAQPQDLASVVPKNQQAIKQSK